MIWKKTELINNLELGISNLELGIEYWVLSNFTVSSNLISILTVNYQLSTVNYQLSTVNYQLSTVN